MQKNVLYRVALLGSAAFRGASREYTRNVGLGVPEARVLSIIGQDAPLSASDVAQRSAMDKGQVSRAITSLIKRGYVKRAAKPGGGRRVMLTPTRQGRAMANKVIAMTERRQERVASRFKAKELDQLVANLDKLLEVLDELNASEDTPAPRRRAG